MIRYLKILIVIAIGTTQAHALELQTRENKLCGVERYVSHTNDNRCPVDLYQSIADSACNEIFKSKQDGKICGYDLGHGSSRCDPAPGSHNPPLQTAPDPERGCPGGYVLTKVPTPKTCRDKSFGHEGWEFCRSPSHPAESYQTCERPEFGVKNYKTCSFYKTPEELDAYIDATKESLEEFRSALPDRQGQLFALLKSENGLGCTITKYLNNPDYTEVVNDLKDKFNLIFGYSYADAVLDCSDETLKSTKIEVKIDSLDCDTLPESLKAVAKPDSITDAQFTQFIKKCNAKRSYDNIVNWFATKQTETDQLLGDLAAKSDPAAAQNLRDLQTNLKAGE